MRLINGTRADDLVDKRLITRQRLVIPLWVSMLGVALRGFGRRLVWAARRWSITLPAAGLPVAWLAWGWQHLALTFAAVAGVLAAWWWLHARSLSFLVLGPVVGNWRLTTRYRRHWRAAMIGTRLAVEHKQAEYLPVIRRCRSTRYTDTLTVRLLHGQTPEDFTAATEGLRHVFGAYRATVRETKPGRVAVRFYAHDPLIKVIPALAPVEPANLAAVPMGLTEEGHSYRLRVQGAHVLVVGGSGAGKASVLWSLILGITPLIRSGAVQLWVIDPKGGMEMILGRRLFARYEDTDTEAMAVLLEDAVAYQDQRTQRLKGVTRQHTPSVDDPYVIVLIDEMASLTGYVTDRDLKRRIHVALSLLLSKGRAPGFSVVAALQDPRKDVLPFRDLFTIRIALRLTEPEQVGMVLRDTARERGARCDQIPRDLPGVGYVVLDDDPTPVRVRFAWVTDVDIRATAREWAPPGPPALEALTAPIDAVEPMGEVSA